MRHRNVWAAGLALGLGVVGLALGQEPPPRGGSGILDRLFTGGPTPTGRAETKQDATARSAPAAAPSVTRKQALDDYLRRLEVCDRLRQIADLQGDEELRNRADVLWMRVKDIYVQRTNPGAASDADEVVLERQLTPAGKNLTPLSATTGRNAGSPAYAEGRR